MLEILNKVPTVVRLEGEQEFFPAGLVHPLHPSISFHEEEPQLKKILNLLSF